MDEDDDGGGDADEEEEEEEEDEDEDDDDESAVAVAVAVAVVGEEGVVDSGLDADDEKKSACMWLIFSSSSNAIYKAIICSDNIIIQNLLRGTTFKSIMKSVIQNFRFNYTTTATVTYAKCRYASLP